MHSRLSFSHLVTLPAALLVASGCAGFSLGVKQQGGLGQVDALLTHVERMQVESAVSKERAMAALEHLRTLLAPEFKGDAIAAHQRFVAAVDQSQAQAKSFQGALKPLKKTGEAVFAEWTANLESFGNIAMRQRSQERLEETRRRHDTILAAAVSVQLAFDAFNGDLRDHALFLEHDFNTTAVALIAQELDGLKSRSKELLKRLDACAAACQAFVEFSAPGAQVAPSPSAAPSAPAATSTPEPAPLTPLPAKPAPKKKPAPKPAPAPAPTKPQGA